MTGGTLLFGFLAGLFSTLSPCVLPLLPIVLGAAAAAHRFGLLALGAGMVLSFTGIGLLAALAGFAAGIFQTVPAILLGIIGLVLLSPALQRRFAMAASPLGNAGNSLITRIAPSGATGQFLIGTVLGAVWSPCVGPTLGYASLLASRGENLTEVTATMLVFGAGAALPLLAIGLLSREALTRWRGRLLGVGTGGKYAMGTGAVIVSALILTGLDHTLEAALLRLSPDWLTNLTTRF